MVEFYSFSPESMSSADTVIPPITDVALSQAYAAVDREIEAIIAEVSAYMHSVSPDIIREAIMHAYVFARAAHEGVYRCSGEPYISHPVGALRELIRIRPDLTTMQAILLHDVPEDTDTTIDEIEKIFGADVAYIVAGMEKLSKIKYRGEERNIGSLRKMFIAMGEDIRVIFVKLADRIHNMKTLHYHPDPAKRERIALETLTIYAPIADRLGIFEFKEALENESFKHLYPAEYQRIIDQLADMRDEENMFLSHIRDEMRDLLTGDDVPILDISYRIKSPLSIYRKMQRKNYDRVKDIYDLFAIRIITESVHDCYDILGMIHSRWVPVPGRFKDYIALPKENKYQSLHTTVVGMFREYRREGDNRTQPTEIQIRTQKMHEQAEIGIAAHFEYSESGKSSIAQDVAWVKELKEILGSTHDSDFLSQVRINIFSDRIFVFTPKGDIKSLPKGATPIDFGYSIHSDIGNHVAIAKVNGKVVPLDYELKNGEHVEVVTDKGKHPSPTWLSFVKTARAKEVIKAYINREQRDELINRGKFMLNSYLMRTFGRPLDRELSILTHVDDVVLDMRAKEDLLVQIGNLSRKPSSVVRGIEHLAALRVESSKKTLAEKASKKATSQTKATPETPDIIIGGERNIPYTLAKCCEPTHGEKIVAYITRHGAMIHRAICPHVSRGNIDRCLPASYGDVQAQDITLRVDFVFQNRIGVFKDLSDIFYRMQINIEDLHTEKIDENDIRMLLTLHIEQEDYYIYDRLIERVRVSIPALRSTKLLSLG